MMALSAMPPKNAATAAQFPVTDPHASVSSSMPLGRISSMET